MLETPRANRTHIAFYGATNSGKSSLINAITKQEISLVSEIAGTTTDPVWKSMEIAGIGACVLVDTAGFDDESQLGAARVELAKRTTLKADIAVIVFDSNDISDISQYETWVADLQKTPTLMVLNKADLVEDTMATKELLEATFQKEVLVTSATTREGVEELIQKLVEIGGELKEKTITGDLCTDGDVVMLVMPQDIQAPKGRLILPQVQTTRELLDKKCLLISVTTDRYLAGLASLKEPPKLIITDSQVFDYVYKHKPESSLLTSFSVLFAGYKGDIRAFIEGVRAIDSLTPTSKVLVSEACTHAPLTEDIGREKIPRMLRKKISPDLQIDLVSGSDFPEDLSQYDLLIHCGACMFNRKHVLSRLERATSQGVPMTNYGVVIAYFTDILDKIVYAD
ncbi:MAG: [FeFe] hydrogenase H-cluster maturation GTPase HydF [Eubacteriales bacterium]